MTGLVSAIGCTSKFLMLQLNMLWRIRDLDYSVSRTYLTEIKIL